MVFYDQLLPVNDRVGIIDYKNSCALHELCDGNRLELTTCRRADRTLFDMLHPSNIMKLKREQFAPSASLGSNDTECWKHISFTNKKRKEINQKMMDKFVKEKKKKYLELKKLSYDDNSQDVKLVQGMPIISRVNCKDYEIVNNQTFVITKIDFSNGTIVADEDQEIEFPFEEFPKLFNVAFCITIYL